MSDSQDAHSTPEPTRADGHPLADPPAGVPQPPPQAQAPGTSPPQSIHADGRTTDPQAPPQRTGRLKELARSRRGRWAAIAAVCVAAGVAVTIVEASSVAHHDATHNRAVFAQSSADITSTLKLALQREEDLVIAASTYFAGHPHASTAEFASWARWAQIFHRYPEVQRLQLIGYVRAPELLAFESRVTGVPIPVTPPAPPVTITRASTTAAAGAPSVSRTFTSTSARVAPPSSIGGFRVVPPGKRAFYCFALASVAARSAKSPQGLDYCAVTSGMSATRDSGVASYAHNSAAHPEPVRVETPVYRGGVTPSSVGGRRGAFVGWLRELLVPRVVLQEVLRGHGEDALRLRYHAGGSNVAFSSGSPPAGAQVATVRVHPGWSAKIFGPSADGAVLKNGNSLGLLIGGCLLSLLIGLLVFLIGSGRAPRLAAPRRKPAPGQDLYDPLTGLPGRALTLDLAERTLARAGRQSGMLAGALCIDLDWFKDVNEKLGREAGDQLLTIVAERLEGVVRAGDIVGRPGEDEFLVLVESAARAVRLDALARRIMEALHKPVELDDFGPSFFVTASIGVAFGRYSSADDLLRDAKLALGEAKAAGKDRYTIFNANMHSLIEGRAVLEAALNAALQDRQFFLLYQPIYDLATGKVASAEALIRWRHPQQGVLPPAEFIPLAEETGLIVPIGRWVLEEACARAAEWNVEGHRVGISATVSAFQLGRDNFVTDVRRALQQSGLEPSLLTLEIAESTVMLDPAAATERMGRLKQLGVRIAIDDFGSGYAYRSDLERMPLDYLKVDRSALAASDDEDYRSWLFQAIVMFGRDLNLAVVAKGVDTYEQMTSVQSMGCRMAQGFFMGKPAAANAVEGLLTSHIPTPDELRATGAS